MTQGMTTSTVAGRLASQESFGAELRRWRERRRVSQLELALRAGTTQRHLSFVENGRSVPGRGMVVRLAESLDLPLRERNELLLHAGYAPAYPESALDEADLHAVRAALQAILAGHEPYPAMIVNRAGELLLANTACGLFFDDLPPHLLTAPVNTRRVALHPDGLAARIINFDTWAPHVTDSLQRELRRNPDPRLETLLEELKRYVTRAPAPADDFGFAVPLELSTPYGPVRLITTLTTFATATDVLLSELRMEAFLPADDGTAERLRQRAADTRASGDPGIFDSLNRVTAH
jgi:transcriptional regulator with XRE-family HTH domain